ncbi:MAG: hypothetical protein Q9208_008542 [Pyrenodesmia sp. 3 TL-2023]
MDSSELLRKLGRQEYRRKNYHGALNFFDSIISHDKSPDIEALDNRAATYEKLGDLHAALKDGRRMVSDYKSSCAVNPPPYISLSVCISNGSKGYLRTGKILRLLDKEETALGIYKYGLRNVPPGDPSFQLLNQMHDDLSRACGPRKARDPLTVLPNEIAEMIMSHFDFRQIVSIIRVSTQWRDYLTSMPGLWTKLDFSAAKSNIPGTAIKKYLQYSRKVATEVVTNRLLFQQDKFLRHVALFCRKLEILQIKDGCSNESLIRAVSITRNLKSLSLSSNCAVTLDCVSQVLGHGSTLVRAEFHHILAPHPPRPPLWPSNLPKLQALTLNYETPSSSSSMMPSVDPLLEHLPEICELKLSNWSSNRTIPSPGNIEMSHLHTLTLTNYQGEVLFHSLPLVRFVKLNRCPLIFRRLSTSDFKPDLRVLGYSKFSISYAELEPEKVLQLIGTNVEELRHLSISHCTTLLEVDLIKMVNMGYMDQLSHLDLSHTHVTDNVIEILVPRARHLRTVKLAATKITGISVKALVTQPGMELVHLDVTDCNDISADAKTMARRKGGLKVLSGMSAFTGKKIRFE